VLTTFGRAIKEFRRTQGATLSWVVVVVVFVVVVIVDTNGLLVVKEK